MAKRKTPPQPAPEPEPVTALATIDEPGEVEVTDQVVAEVAESIRQLHRRSSLRYADEVGSLILTRFFAGSEAAFRSRAAKDNSLRRLAEQDDLPLGRSALHQMVEVHIIIARKGGVDTLGSLTQSHVRAVAGLPPPKQDQLLATAQANRWPVTRIVAAAAKGRTKKSAGGRPALPRFVKALNALKKYAGAVSDLGQDHNAVETLSEDAIKRLLAIAGGVKAQLETLQGLLTSRADG